jgi:hypothetical protein
MKLMYEEAKLRIGRLRPIVCLIYPRSKGKVQGRFISATLKGITIHRVSLNLRRIIIKASYLLRRTTGGIQGRTPTYLKKATDDLIDHQRGSWDRSRRSKDNR